MKRAMRVIAGSHKGRPLLGPVGSRLRPTSDRVKEALFSILGSRVQGARFLDLYAGTGAIGIEALSRGAQRAVFVEPNSASLQVLQANLNRCGLSQLADVHACHDTDFLRREDLWGPPYDLVYADPPYGHDCEEHLLPSLGCGAMMARDGIVVLEHATKRSVPPQVGRLTRVRDYRYGDTTLSVYGLQAEGTPTV
ncbi:MAG: 16S rRNA (guanine(966)-N(2))-methyltransferase RsmD [Nitrospiraceae bacterium]